MEGSCGSLSKGMPGVKANCRSPQEDGPLRMQEFGWRGSGPGWVRENRDGKRIAQDCDRVIDTITSCSAPLGLPPHSGIVHEEGAYTIGGASPVCLSVSPWEGLDGKKEGLS